MSGTELRRAHFVEQLHDLLERPADAANFRWTADGVSFEITETQSLALYALSPKWSFRSLASFIRQLSYYGFVRLSDRRKTQHRRGASGDKIVFFHPSGFFTRGDNSRLEMIQRKPRDRSKSARSQTSLPESDAQSRPSPIYRSLSTYSPSKSSVSGYGTPMTHPARSPRRPNFGRASTWNGSSGLVVDGSAGYSMTPDLPRYSHAEPSSAWTNWAGDLHLPEAGSSSRPFVFDEEPIPFQALGSRPAPEASYWSAWARTCGGTEPALAHVTPSAPAALPNGLTMRGFDEYQPILTPPALVDDARRRGYFDSANDSMYSTDSPSVPHSVQSRSAEPGYAVGPKSTTSDPRSLQRPNRLRTVPLPSSPLCDLGLHFDNASAGGGRSRASPLYCS